MSLLEVRGLVKRFPGPRHGVRRGEPVTVVDDVSFDIERGRTVALVGESGAGKSTTSYLVLRLLEADAGSVVLDGTEVRNLSHKELRRFRTRMQIVFQDPHSSLDPRVPVGRSVAEPLKVLTDMNRSDREALALSMMRRMALRPAIAERFPHELSGGQLQRIAIARALTLHPALIVCDEAVSALDVSVRAQVLNLLLDIQDEMQVSYLFVAHDLAIVENIAHEVIVMQHGRIVETGPVGHVFASPTQDYTRALLDAIPVADPRERTWGVPA
jgi:peptide/nickel transport system ATP-binding protein/oligopeptide transport system ATP-binding protein